MKVRLKRDRTIHDVDRWAEPLWIDGHKVKQSAVTPLVNQHEDYPAFRQHFYVLLTNFGGEKYIARTRTGKDIKGDFQYSGAKLPALGETVFTKVNNLGKGKVMGYFTEDQWLGVIVELAKQPRWHLEANGPGEFACLFGAEIE